LTIGFGILRRRRAATLLQSDNRQAFQASLAFSGYRNAFLGDFDEGERLELEEGATDKR
jgi:hypothetical protein